MTNWTVLAVMVALGAIYFVLPNRTRPDLFFAVTVDPGFPETESGRGILHVYRWLIVAITVIMLAAQLAAGVLLARPHPGAIAAITFAQVILLNVAMVYARSRTLAFASTPSPVRESNLARPQLALPGGLGIALGPLAILAVISVLAWVRWDSLPARVPIHFGPSGPDQWITRNVANVAGFLLVHVGMVASFLAMQFWMVKSMRRIHAQGDLSHSEDRFKRLSLLLLQAAAYFVVVPPAVIFLTSDENHVLFRALPWIVGGFVGFTFLCIVLMLWWGQGGGRMAVPAAPGAPTGDATPDDCWKFGIVYYNPDDPAVMVEKRFGIGQTLNFARVQSWMLVALILVPIIATYWFLK